MTRTSNMIKEEGFNDAGASKQHQTYDDVEMGDDTVVTHPANSPPSTGYGTPSSTRTFQSRRSEHALEADVSQVANLSDAEDGIKTMGRGVATVAEAMAELRLLGVSHNYGVPELCAMGEQSAGKSSLIGALAGIHLPSGPGTCTRVPVQIKTADDPTPGATWSCRVLLELAYCHSRLGRVAGPTNRIGPWWERDIPHLIEFMIINNKEDLKEAMKAAQMAILNPQHNPADYVPGIGERHGNLSTMEKFSPNLIVLEISEPGHQTLSFIDLPGIIQIGETSELVDLVSKLVKHFVKRKNTLLLCALPMSVDPQNSAAIRFVKEAKATDRCIGVVTKPDLLNHSDIKPIWVPLLRGQKEGFSMGYNYYVTKQPEKEVSHAQAQIEEEAFFDTMAPWTTDFSEFRDRCGTKNLRDVLARKLAYRIQLELPNIRMKIEEKAANIDRRLNSLPKCVVGEVQPRVLRQLGKFSNSIQHALDSRSAFFMQWRDVRRQFRDAVVLMKPIITLKDKSDFTSIPPPTPNFKERDINAKATGADMFVEIMSTDEESTVSNTPLARKNGKRELASSPDTPARKMAASGGRSGKGVDISRPMRSLPQRGHFINYKDLAIRFSLRDIQTTIRNFGVCDLPGDVDPQAKVNLCQRSVEIWEQPMKTLWQVVANQLETLFKDALDRCLADYYQTDLYSEAGEQVKNFIDLAGVELQKTVEHLYETESMNPFTVNEEAFDLYKRDALHNIKDKRKKLRATAFQDRAEIAVGKYTYGARRADLLAKITDAQLGPDPFEKEIECAAHLQGYYKLASMRWVDNVCQAVQGQLFSFVRNNITTLLENKLGVMGDGGEERSRVLVEKIDPEIALERQRLQEEKESLKKAHQRLNQLFRELALEDHKSTPASMPLQMPMRMPTPHIESVYPSAVSVAASEEDLPGEVRDHNYA